MGDEWHTPGVKAILHTILQQSESEYPTPTRTLIVSNRPSPDDVFQVSTLDDVTWSDMPLSTTQAMWETTFPRNSHAGLGRPFYEQNILTSMKHFRKVPTQSDVAISRKCCFPHGKQVACLCLYIKDYPTLRQSDGCILHYFTLLQCYASQTKILENETAGRACLFEVLFEVLFEGEYSIWATTPRKLPRKVTRPAVSFSKILVWDA